MTENRTVRCAFVLCLLLGACRPAAGPSAHGSGAPAAAVVEPATEGSASPVSALGGCADDEVFVPEQTVSLDVWMVTGIGFHGRTPAYMNALLPERGRNCRGEESLRDDRAEDVCVDYRSYWFRPVGAQPVLPQPYEVHLAGGRCVMQQEVSWAEWQMILPDVQPVGVTPAPGYPVSGVRPEEVLLFANRKSVLSGLSPCYPDNWERSDELWALLEQGQQPFDTSEMWSCTGYRLPTVIEHWAISELGRPAQPTRPLVTAEERCEVFEGSGLNTGCDGVEDVRPVASGAVDALGLRHMRGNVAELTNELQWLDVPSAWQGVSPGSPAIRRGPPGDGDMGMYNFAVGWEATAEVFRWVAAGGCASCDPTFSTIGPHLEVTVRDEEAGFRLIRRAVPPQDDAAP